MGSRKSVKNHCGLCKGPVDWHCDAAKASQMKRCLDPKCPRHFKMKNFKRVGDDA